MTTRLLSVSLLSAWTFDFPKNETRPVKAVLRCRDDSGIDDPDHWALVKRETFSYEGAWAKIEELRKAGWKVG